MSLLRMSISGGILILAIITVRAIFHNRVPKGTFLALWGIAILRLLLPFSVPSVFSVYTLTDSVMEAFGIAGENDDGFNGLKEADKAVDFGMQNKEKRLDGGEEWDFTDMENPYIGNSYLENSRTEADYRNGNVAFLMSKEPDKVGRGDKTNQEEGKISDGLFSGWTRIRNSNLFQIGRIVWCIGTVLCAAYFTASGLYLRKKFRTAVLLRNDFLSGWLSVHRLRRQISVRCSDRIEAPMTYGILRPVILLPRKLAEMMMRSAGSQRRQDSTGPLPQKQADMLIQDTNSQQRQDSADLLPQKQADMLMRDTGSRHKRNSDDLLTQKKDRSNTRQLELILQHEYVHICRFDTLTKLIAAAALCVHWFNPLVWAMYFLFNQDLELACDESVVRQLGMDSRKAYALTLIDMEERKSGLSPMYSSFSKNAIEERITAIMKIKKTTFGAILLAAMLVSSVAAVFATSAMARTQNEQPVSGLDYTKEDWEKLETLRFDGYENMSVAQFQSKAWTLCDQPEYRDAIERFSTDDTLYEMKDSNEMAAFLFYVLDPLTAEKWKTRSFDGSVVTEYPGTSDNATLEYSLTLTIWNPDRLTVKEYCDARVGVSENLRDWFMERKPEELQDAARMWDLMVDEDEGVIPRLVKEWGSECLGINIVPFYTPLVYADVPDEDEELLRINQSQRQAQWDELLAPYTRFGLTYHYDQSTDDFKLYFQGKEVRGIVDEEKGLWISEHAGIGTYAQDAVELYAVYEDGELTGLREANQEEQKDWSKIRQKNTDGLLGGEDENRGTPGTEEDYLSLLTLKTADFKTMSLAKFNQALLEWANEDYDRMERIGIDAAWNDIQVPLQEDELSFAKLTVVLSGLENGERIKKNYRGWEEDPVHDQYLPDKMAIDSGMGAWCNLYYQFSYHIEDMNAITVGERDRCIKGFMEAVQEFWEETDIEILLKMEETDVVAKLQEIAAKWSNEQITIHIREDYVGFECMDERNRESD